jgi:PDZ domain-containing protein
MPRILRLLLISAIVAAIATGGVLVWALQADSSDFAFVPRAAVPTIGVVTVAGQEPAPKGAGSLFYSTVGVRHATIFETWFGVADGGELLPAHSILQPGESEADRSRLDSVAMDSSQSAATVVGLRALGVPVTVKSKGVRIVGIDPQAPIATSGAELGDIIVAVGEERINTTDELRAELTAVGAKKPVTLTLHRASEMETVTTQTIKGPKNTPMLGIVPSEASVVVSTRKVTYTIEGVGGPSAGLAFALQIYSAGKGYANLKGLRVAATGTINMQGTVGPVGGTSEKAIGAGRVDADLFLVPKANVADARAGAPNGVRVIGVNNFTDALRAIDDAATPQASKAAQ